MPLFDAVLSGNCFKRHEVEVILYIHALLESWYNVTHKPNTNTAHVAAIQCAHCLYSTEVPSCREIDPLLKRQDAIEAEIISGEMLLLDFDSSCFQPVYGPIDALLKLLSVTLQSVESRSLVQNAITSGEISDDVMRNVLQNESDSDIYVKLVCRTYRHINKKRKPLIAEALKRINSWS